MKADMSKCQKYFDCQGCASCMRRIVTGNEPCKRKLKELIVGTWEKWLLITALRYLIRWLSSNEKNQKKPLNAKEESQAKTQIDRAFFDIGFSLPATKKRKESE